MTWKCEFGESDKGCCKGKRSHLNCGGALQNVIVVRLSIATPYLANTFLLHYTRAETHDNLNLHWSSSSANRLQVPYLTYHTSRSSQHAAAQVADRAEDGLWLRDAGARRARRHGTSWEPTTESSSLILRSGMPTTSSKKTTAFAQRPSAAYQRRQTPAL